MHAVSRTRAETIQGLAQQEFSNVVWLAPENGEWLAGTYGHLTVYMDPCRASSNKARKKEVVRGNSLRATEAHLRCRPVNDRDIP